MKRLTLPLSDEETRALRAGEGVLLSGETIVWLVGRRIDDRYKVRQDAHRVIRITL